MPLDSALRLPVGAVTPITGVYSSAGFIGYTETHLVIPPWLKQCDGTAISEPKSPDNGFYVPDLTSGVFFQGSASGGVFGGNVNNEISIHHHHTVDISYGTSDITQANYSSVGHSHDFILGWSGPTYVNQEEYESGTHSHSVQSHYHYTGLHTHSIPGSTSHTHSLSSHGHKWGERKKEPGSTSNWALIVLDDYLDSEALADDWDTSSRGRFYLSNPGTGASLSYYGLPQIASGDKGDLPVLSPGASDFLYTSGAVDASSAATNTTGSSSTSITSGAYTTNQTSNTGQLTAGASSEPTVTRSGSYAFNNTLQDPTTTDASGDHTDILSRDSDASIDSRTFTSDSKYPSVLDIQPQYLDVVFYKRIY